jgi:hypothetical protein
MEFIKNNKHPLRLISMAWGESYVDDFLELCLPAVLAPGNLPVLAESFSTELVFVTETLFFDKVKAHPAWKAAARISGVRLVSLDDLVHRPDSYGMSITYALYRGFEDLGADMINCYMVFICTDFILADGSYRGLLPYLLRGERLLVSPSYCAVSEDVRPLLLAAKDTDSSVLSVSPRRLANMVLRHRHLSVRAKTVNQQFFSVGQIEQFYWIVDERTLLARQFPAAVIAMKPEHYLQELGSLWDYGVIADFCPSMKFVTLGDSDNYLMLELRERDNPKGKLQLGWPSTDNIAKGLLGVITDYTLAIGRAQFTLHSGDLPADINVSHGMLDAFVEKVLEKLPARLPSHHDHLQWVIHYNRFHEARREFFAQQAAVESSTAQATSFVENGNPTLDEAGNGELMDMAEECFASDVVFGKYASTRHLPKAETLEAALRTLGRYIEQTRLFENAHASLAATFERRLDAPVDLKKFKARKDELTHLVKQIDQNGSAAHAALKHYMDHSLDRLREVACDLGLMEQELTSPAVEEHPRISVYREPQSALHRLSSRLFGAPGKYRPWHWKHSSTCQALEAANEYLMESEKDVLLVLHRGSSMFHVPDQVRSVEEIQIEATDMSSRLRKKINSGTKFDCCLINADLSKLDRLNELYDLVRPALKKGGLIIAIFINEELADLGRVDTKFINRIFPVCGPATIIYSGNWASVVAFNLRNGVYKFFIKYLHLPNALCVALGMLAAAPFATIASSLEYKRVPESHHQLPSKLTSVTVIINIG